MRIKAVIVEGPADAATIAAIRHALASQEETVVFAPPSIASIVERVGFETGVRPDDIRSERRDRAATRARFAAAWLAKRLTAKSHAQIGRALRRDHSTIVHAVQRGEQWRAVDPAFRALTDRLARELEVGA